ncbi:adventurous gliding motility lipoprotein CglD [Hyalangium rubrum]|uniref:Adventurous gliding motility lipoprotein CglD n=1 Tax=Hyalangium rubrum TaxID=3103134 RepID=A0ABU5HGY1_9BACT|nr:adventurous gliding motility lipoprotein CglD [Hyalangium sp. s54d21]MDY7232715.1 adventurous gliding motility lipoprotein CglD [Hyalangium sp. s54d21]
MKRLLLHTTLLFSVVLTAAACGDSPPGEPDSGIDAGTQDSGTPGGDSDAGSSDGGSSDSGTDPGVPDGGSSDSGTDPGNPDGGSPDGGTDPGTPDGGAPDSGTNPGTPDGGAPDGGNGGGTDAGTQPLPTDPADPNNASKDTDCDGLSDKVEFETDRGDNRKTHPGVADTDGDGLLDGLELGIATPVAGTSCVLPPDADPLLKTSPVRADTDGDGLKDGLEDANRNGRVDPGETHPLRLDTDCDGLIDGPSSGSTQGEDENANGTPEPSETDPLEFDTDGDALSDGVEQGVTVNAEPAHCTGIFIPDADPNTTTDPTNPDSDSDGVSDGTEDSNQNGRVDPGEMDPQVPDASGPVGQVCPTNQLRPVSFQSPEGLDLKLALPPSFTEVTPIQMNNEAKGLVGYDNTSHVTFLAIHRAAPMGSMDPLGDEEALRPAIASQGALFNRTAQLFTTWDGFPAVQAFYDQVGSTTDLKRRTDALVDALAPGSTGRLSPPASGYTGNFRLQALFVHRSDQSVVVLIAVAPLQNVTGPNHSTPAVFSAKDLSAGSALAQFGEPTRVACERFQLSPSNKVDFLFVVDDSGSMMTSQLSLAASAQAAVDALNASSLDWRMAMVTSNYHFGTQANSGRLRRFTRNVNKVRAWLTEGSTCQGNVCTGVPTTPAPATCPADTSEGANGGCWLGINGSGSEGILGAARKAIDDLTPGSSPGTEVDHLARQDAKLVVVLLGDADDQTISYGATQTNCGSGGTQDRAGSSCESVQNFVRFFGDKANPTLVPTNKTSKHITVHGIVCPSGSFCGCTEGSGCNATNASREFNPQPMNGLSQQRHSVVVNVSGGVLGSILDVNSIIASMEVIIDNVIGSSGYPMSNPPIGASIKVAMDSVSDPSACTAHDIPRSTINGFDFDGQARTLSLFGACRPASEASQGAVSFRYWVDTQEDPNGIAPCAEDPRYSPTEPDHCAGLLWGCNATGDQCVCMPDCGGACGTGTRCALSTCTCEPIGG